jgi:putative NIF3 family GTP cyclohydrolase 1 type 2
VGDPDRPVRRVALCSGSGAGFMDQVVASSCDVYVTGDIKYHEAQRAVEEGLALVDVGHFASERIVVPPLASYLSACAARERAEVEVLTALRERDPFWFLGTSPA